MVGQSIARIGDRDGCTTTGAGLLYAEQGLGDALQCLRYVGLATVKGVSFQALQPCSRLEGVPLALSPLPVGDLLVTARIIAGLDVVVSVDTTIVHLAGLLGEPTLLLNRYAGDWRWAAASAFPAEAAASPGALERSVWYPSVRIVRQPAPEGDVPSWHHPLATAACWLEQAVLCKEQGGCSHEL
jgi:hypothetical protein